MYVRTKGKKNPKSYGTYVRRVLNWNEIFFLWKSYQGWIYFYVDSKHSLCKDTDTFSQKLYARSLVLTLRASIWFVYTLHQFCDLLFFNFRWEQASPVYRHNQFFVNYAFCNFVDSKHSICGHTPSFSEKIRVPTNTKKHLEEPKPLDWFSEKLKNPCQSIRDLTKIFHSCIIALKC